MTRTESWRDNVTVYAASSNLALARELAVQSIASGLESGLSLEEVSEGDIYDGSRRMGRWSVTA